ncbi:(Fe-S)-binding protein [Desulfurispora thermophila]|uniref:(Fe-S)-binding protein n=1 Tax=Desulfurispora thermophila TaxID=265470 RepID=UPI0003664F52|nr:(Fe-S)-binding protein [Desulfurispora thermophila]
MFKLLVFTLLLAAALFFFGRAVQEKLRLLRLGRPVQYNQHGQRLRDFLVYVLGQRKLLQERFGVVHVVIFWGFIIISLGTLQFVGEGLYAYWRLPGLGQWPWFYFALNLASLAVLVALAAAAWRRYVIRPARLTQNRDAAIILLCIAGLIITELLASGSRLLSEPEPRFSKAFVYQAVAAVLQAGGLKSWAAQMAEMYWWLHVLILLSFLAYIPRSKHLHMLAAPLNVYLRTPGPRGGQLALLNLEDEQIERFGAGQITDYTRKQLLDLFACAECGRCQDNCPAYLSGKPLSPKQLINNLKHHLLEQGPRLLAAQNGSGQGEVAREQDEAAEVAEFLLEKTVTPDEVWSCTTCFACQQACPVGNEHIPKIIDLRRYLVMDEGTMPQEAVLASRNVEKNGNPWGVGWNKRADWATDLDLPTVGEAEHVDWLYWVGCAGAFDLRSQKVARAVVQVLQAAGLKVAILGAEEKCCGDSIRRLGNEYLYQSLAQENIEVLQGYGVKNIVTHCPHCLNTLKNEYPQLGGDFHVLHHTQLIAALIEEGRLRFRPESTPVRLAYHDSCYLGRYNGEFAAPRRVLEQIPGLELLEAGRNKAFSFCCGAGGGRMWLEERQGERINQMRTGQLLETNPDVLGVNCPFCLTMLEDGLKMREIEHIAVLDVAELVARAIDIPVARPEEEDEEIVA